MKYIKSVILKNFQSHKHTVVDFNNRLNVIVGPSDSGKTAILRAIKWALYNDPSGDYFIREGETYSSVTIIFSDETKVKRYRSKSKNIYYLYDEYDNELKFEGFGVHVPEEILESTGIKKILLDKNISKSINISDQLEGAFLLSEKGSIRASSIGYLVGVDIIDDALKETLREVRNLSTNKRNIDEHILILENELSEYDYLEELEIKADKLEWTLNKINRKKESLNKLKDMLLKFSQLKIEKDKLDIYIDRLKNLDELEIILKNIELNNIKYNQLNKQKILLDTNKLNRENNNQIVKKLKNIDKIELNINKISLQSSKKLQLTKINFQLKKNINESNKYKVINNKLGNIDDLNNKLTKINQIIVQLNKLSKIENKANNINKSLYKGQFYVNKLKNMDIISQNCLKLEIKLKQINILTKLSSDYNNNKKSILKLSNEIKEYKEQSKILSDKYKNILLEKATCPLCFSHIDDKKADFIVDQYK